MSGLPTISVLIAARKDSKYLAKFLFGLLDRTALLDHTQVLVMLNEQDTWNAELVQYFEQHAGVQFFRENAGLGRSGLHLYFNELASHAKGDWLVYFCDDHFVTMNDWDLYVRQTIHAQQLDSKLPWCIVPKFDNAGAMNHIVSRGYVEALDGVLGRHGWIDSYINAVNQLAFGDISPYVIRLDADMFHDFTHDSPSPMLEAAVQSMTPDTVELPQLGSQIVNDLIQEDALKLVRKVRER